MSDQLGTLALSRHDVACRAAAKAVDVVRVYAKQAKDRKMEIDAAEIRIRAERRLGELWRRERRRSASRPARAGTSRAGSLLAG